MTAYVELCRRCREHPVMQKHVRVDNHLVLTELPYCAVCHEQLVDAHFREQEGLDRL